MSAKGPPGALTKELNESVTNLLGPNVKISLKCLVKMEIKAEKTDTKILAFSACRLFILAAKIPTKIEQTFHYLDINVIESKRPNQLTLTVTLPPNEATKSFTFLAMDPDDGEEINLMIIQLGTAIKTIFPQVPLHHIIRRIEVFPETRLQAMIEYNEVVESKAKDFLLSSESGPTVVPPPASPIIGPCGNFSTQYACLCDYFGLPYREEVAWDVDTIYFTHTITELSLLDFEHLESKDLVPIIAALAYNGWFTKFRASGVKLIGGGSGAKVDQEVAEQIVNLLRRSSSLEEVFLDNTGAKGEFVNKLMLAVISSSQTSLHTIDLSHNMIEDKGIKNLCGFVAKANTGSPLHSSASPAPRTNKGLVHLNLSRTGLTSRGISDLAEALSLNKAMPTTLSYLNLSENLLKDDVNKLYSFLAQPNCILSLDLSGTECSLDTVFGALLRGCTQKLAHLNLSRNQFTSKKSHRDVNVPPSFKTFFSSTIALKSINLSSNKLPNEALKAMLLGLACNEIATDVYINLSSNDLKSSGASVLETCVPDIRCLSGLDLSDNGFEAEASTVITALSRNKSLKRLSIGRNFNNVKPKHMPRVLDSLVQLLQDDDSTLESLSIADSKLRSDTCLIINALSNNQSLMNIDITGNLMGLSGAKTLAKALQVNSKLESIYMDRNNVPTAGFIDVAYALERNFVLKHLPIPLQDVTAAMKVGSANEKIEAAVAKIEELLRRNNLPHSLLRSSRGSHIAGAAGSLHNHLSYDSGTYTMIDKLMLHVQDILTNWSSAATPLAGSLRSRRGHEAGLGVAIGPGLRLSLESPEGSSESIESRTESVIRAENYLKEANNAKNLFTRLHQQFILAVPSSIDSSLSNLSKPIEAKLTEFVFELKSTLEAHIQDTTALMLQCVQQQCPNVILNSEKLQHDLQRIHSNSVNSRHFPSTNFLESCFVEQVGSMITFKVEDVLLGIAASICDRVLDEVIESLSSSHRILTEGGTCPTANERSSTPDVLRNRVGNWFDGGSSSRDSSTEGNLSSVGGAGGGGGRDRGGCGGNIKEEADNTGMATPKLPNQKRQSLYARRLRPQSVMDGLTADDFPDLLPKTESTGGGTPNSGLDSGPSSLMSATSGEKLEHLVKSRPKRPKTRAPTRAAINSSIAAGPEKGIEDESDELLTNEKLDDGLETFFRKPTVEVLPKPVAQPRTGLVRNFASHFGVRSTCEKYSCVSPKSPADEMSTSLYVEQLENSSPQGGTTTTLISRMEEVTRSRSSPNLGIRKQQSQQQLQLQQQQQQQQNAAVLTPGSPRNSSPGSEEIAAILNRVSSPVPVEQHTDMLAEMKAKGGKRSLAPTPTPSASDETSSSVTTTSTTSSAATLASVRLRASAFGDVLKSPSKSSLMSEDGSLHETAPTRSIGSTSKPPQGPTQQSSKQRPKSVVGLSLAKFEKTDIDIDCVSEGTLESAQSTSGSETSSTNSKSNSLKNHSKGQSESGETSKIRKTMAAFKNSITSGSTNSEPKMSKSKFYTSSSLSSAASSSSTTTTSNNSTSKGSSKH